MWQGYATWKKRDEEEKRRQNEQFNKIEQS